MTSQQLLEDDPLQQRLKFAGSIGVFKCIGEWWLIFCHRLPPSLVKFIFMGQLL